MYSLSSTFFSLAHLFVQRILINLNTAPVFPCYLFEQLSVDFSTLHNSSGLVWKHTHTQASFCCVPARLDLDVINAARWPTERLCFSFKIAHSGLTEYNKKSGFNCMFVVCIAYYIWAGPPSPTSNYVLSADGKGLHTHFHPAGICNCVNALCGCWSGCEVWEAMCYWRNTLVPVRLGSRASRQVVVGLNEGRREHLWHRAAFLSDL